MKTLSHSFLPVLVYFLSMPFSAYHQNLQGQWNGSLHVQGTELRVVFHVTMKNNQYSATMDSPDQNVSGIVVTAINFSYPNVKFESSTIGAVYEGTMADDRITGTWRQSGQTFPLVLSRVEDQK